MIPGAIDCIQGDSTWFKCRAGCVTASRVADAVAKLKKSTDESAARESLRFKIMGEVLTGKVSGNYVSTEMVTGIEREPLARAEYEMLTGVPVEQVGFVYHPTIKMAGASPDGLVGQDGLIEIKCPMLETHLRYAIGEVVPEKYKPQMLWQMACTERYWVDFVSYHPDVPEPNQLFVKRFLRNEEADAVIRGMELEVIQFLQEVDEMVAKLKASNRAAAEVGA